MAVVHYERADRTTPAHLEGLTEADDVRHDGGKVTCRRCLTWMGAKAPAPRDPSYAVPSPSIEGSR